MHSSYNSHLSRELEDWKSMKTPDHCPDYEQTTIEYVQRTELQTLLDCVSASICHSGSSGFVFEIE